MDSRQDSPSRPARSSASEANRGAEGAASQEGGLGRSPATETALRRLPSPRGLGAGPRARGHSGGPSKLGCSTSSGGGRAVPPK